MALHVVRAHAVSWHGRGLPMVSPSKSGLLSSSYRATSYNATTVGPTMKILSDLTNPQRPHLQMSSLLALEWDFQHKFWETQKPKPWQVRGGWDLDQGSSCLSPMNFPAEQGGLIPTLVPRLVWTSGTGMQGHKKPAIGDEGVKAWLPIPWMHGLAQSFEGWRLSKSENTLGCILSWV